MITLKELISENNFKTFRQIRDEFDPNGLNHDLTLKCVKCGTTNTCRCSKPKRKFDGICNDCSKNSLSLNEDRSKESVEFGCLMAYIPKKQQDLLFEFGKVLVKESDLYKEGSEFGREGDAHVTIRYGFTKDLTPDKIKEIIKDLKCFTVTAKSITLFKANKDKKYDVVKFDIESDILTRPNKETKKFPNEESYPEYHPHLTVAYVKENTFKNVTNDLSIELPIDKIVYSPIKGNKIIINLSKSKLDESITNRNYDLEIKQLESEWDRLDSMGNQEIKQQEITKDIQSLQKEKLKWEKLHLAAR